MLLELKNVAAGYLKGVNVLQGASLYVGKGEIVCLIGPNGAGKSTVLRAVSGLISPSEGEIVFDGEMIGRMRPDLVLRKGIAHVPQGHSSFPMMSIHENLLMGAFSLSNRVQRQQRLEQIYGMFNMLNERRQSKAGNLSGGQQKLLEIGRALMMQPKLMMLDEPSLGLDPKTSRTVFDTIQHLRNETGITILMVEQNARSGLSISDRGYVLELGRERLEGPAKDLLDNPKVAQLYLGGSIMEESKTASEVMEQTVNEI
jgi:ABC-type branched-subunit amino acid transport system ATPase component